MSVIKDETVFRKIKNIVEQRSIPSDFSTMTYEPHPRESRFAFLHRERLVGEIVIERNNKMRIVCYENDLDEYFEGIAEWAEIELNADSLHRWGEITVVLC